jgi:hypothetical protein
MFEKVNKLPYVLDILFFSTKIQNNEAYVFDFVIQVDNIAFLTRINLDWLLRVEKNRRKHRLVPLMSANLSFEITFLPCKNVKTVLVAGHVDPISHIGRQNPGNY